MAFNHSIVENNGSRVITLTGRLLHMDEARLLDSDLENLVADGHLKYCIDMSALEHMNSTGLGLLVRFLTRIRNAGGELVLANVNDTLNKLLIITKLERVFHISGSVEEAIDYLSNN